jgi:hypothetical protein
MQQRHHIRPIAFEKAYHRVRTTAPIEQIGSGAIAMVD